MTGSNQQLPLDPDLEAVGDSAGHLRPVRL
jgi:hypothetical protein